MIEFMVAFFITIMAGYLGYCIAQFRFHGRAAAMFGDFAEISRERLLTSKDWWDGWNTYFGGTR